MSGSFQRKSLHRKLIYSALIVGLLTLTLVVRNADFAIGSVQVRGAAPQAKAMELREEDMGEGDLTGSALMLTLTGSRGLVVCYLWKDATDLQARNEWNQLELRIRLITKLQPHFLTPWLYQSWNLAYNVSVEPDNNFDKYFYVASGMQLLAQGERRNKDNPDLRYNLAFYLQDKIGQADEQNTFRSLYELSCTDPAERNPVLFQADPSRPDAIDWAQFERFCTAHPFLVRRLREGLGKVRPADVIRFLADSRKIPSLYQDRTEDTQGATPLKSLDDRFPMLPPRSRYEPNEAVYDGMGEIPYYLANNFVWARAWYEYAQDPIYETPARLPHHRLCIFRSYPARAEAYVAERLEKEGWFGLEGWKIPDWFPAPGAKLGMGKKTVTLGVDHDRPWAEEAWDKAYRAYFALGQDTPDGRYRGLNKSKSEQALLSRLESMTYHEDRMVTNYPHWLAVTNVERTPEAVQGRHKFADATKHMHLRLNAQALQDFEDPAAFGPPSTWDRLHCTGWKKLFLDPAHRDWREDLDVQEEIYKLQEKYLKLFRTARQDQFNKIKLEMDAISQAAGLHAGLPWQPTLEFGPFNKLTVQGPFDDVDDDLQPLIDSAVKPQAATPTMDVETMKRMMQQQQGKMRQQMERMRPPGVK